MVDICDHILLATWALKARTKLCSDDGTGNSFLAAPTVHVHDGGQVLFDQCQNEHRTSERFRQRTWTWGCGINVQRSGLFQQLMVWSELVRHP